MCSSLGDVQDKLSKLVSDETYQDIEEFLTPHFDANPLSGKSNKRHWKIVRDGHGRWREIKPQKNEKKDQGRYDNDSKRTNLASQGGKLVFSNNILDSVKSSPKPLSRNTTSSSSPSVSVPRRDYKTLSTTMRSNIFPGVGNYGWHSQSNEVHTESALNLGRHRGHDLRDEFYGIQRDELGAWNEASVHHERMKKSWDAYLESLAKVGRVVTQMQPSDKNTDLRIQQIGPEPKKMKKKVKNSEKNKIQATSIEDNSKSQVNDSKEEMSPKLSEPVNDDDDFWDFYDQPFVKS